MSQTVNGHTITRDELTIDGESVRLYDIDGELYPSMSTVAGHHHNPELEKILQNWKEKYDGSDGVAHYKDIKHLKACRGTIAHALTLDEFYDGELWGEEEETAVDRLKNFQEYRKSYIDHEQYPWNPDEIQFFEDGENPIEWAERTSEEIKDMLLNDVLTHVDEPIAVERYLYSEELGIAGQVDFVYRHVNGDIVVCDIKTSKHVSEKYMIQSAGYAGGFEEQYGETVDRLQIARACPESYDEKSESQIDIMWYSQDTEWNNRDELEETVRELSEEVDEIVSKNKN